MNHIYLEIKELENTLDMIQRDVNYEINRLRDELREVRMQTAREQEEQHGHRPNHHNNCLCSVHCLYLGNIKE